MTVKHAYTWQSSYTKLKEQELQDTHSYHHQKQKEDHYWLVHLLNFASDFPFLHDVGKNEEEGEEEMVGWKKKSQC